MGYRDRVVLSDETIRLMGGRAGNVRTYEPPDGFENQGRAFRIRDKMKAWIADPDFRVAMGHNLEFVLDRLLCAGIIFEEDYIALHYQAWPWDKPKEKPE